LTEVYDSRMREWMKRAARRASIRMHEGVYAAVSVRATKRRRGSGPLGGLGADAVGMSTVLEAVVAPQCGLRVAALSCITNCAAGLGKGPLSHAGILAGGEWVRGMRCGCCGRSSGPTGWRRGGGRGRRNNLVEKPVSIPRLMPRRAAG
jgi:purine-nucleoside phosphorylase